MAEWFNQPSDKVAPALIGCTLHRKLDDGRYFSGHIVETEAYGPGDPAMFAYKRRTERNAVVFGPAGVSYVYQIYGRYFCFNIVTDAENIASTVLIRAIDLETVPPALENLKAQQRHRLAAGPGKLCTFLEINRALNGINLNPQAGLWLEHRTEDIEELLTQSDTEVVQTTRIGLTKGKNIPWRWYLSNSLAVSRR